LELAVKISSGFIALMFMVSAPLLHAATPPPGAPSQATLLRNWAFSRCLAQVYADAAVKADARATASAYLEYGRQPIEAYTALQVLVDKAAARQLAGSIPGAFHTMQCIDLRDSPELEAEVRRWVDRRP